MLVIVLGVAAGAYAMQGKPEPKQDEEYYFFAVSGGQVNPSSPLNQEPMTLEEFEQVNPLDCPTGNNADCIRAWEPGHTPTATGPADYTIRKL